MKITKENLEHVQEVLNKYGVRGLNDLDQRLFEWEEDNMKLWDVKVTRPVTFKIRVNAVDSATAIRVANDILDHGNLGPNAEHGSYEIHDTAFYAEKKPTTSAKEVLFDD